MYRESTALIMFKWVRNRPEFQEEKERVGSQDQHQTDEIIERKAFIKFFAKVTITSYYISKFLSE